MVFKNEKVKRYFSLFTIVIFCNLNFSCAYYRVKSGRVGADSTIKTLDRNDYGNNHYVLHVGDAMWELKDFELGNKAMTGVLSPFEGQPYEMYKRMIKDESRRITMKDSKLVYQIHIYADSFEQNGEAVQIPENAVTRLDLFDLNQGVRVASVLGTSLLIGVGGIALFLAIACGCPHVYVYNGESYTIDNTLFTGAVAPQLERSDYKLMPDYFSESTKYQFTIKNDEQEMQYTNLLKLLVVSHDEGSEVYPDQHGNINLIKDPVMPSKLVDDGGNDLIELIGYQDGRAFVFNNATADDFSNVYATFETPIDKENAKLVLQLKNTEWAGYVYGEFGKLFGSYYDNWVKRNQRKKTGEEMRADQKKHGLPLLVSVKSGDEWIDIETVDLMGTISYNGLVVNIPQELMSDRELQVRIRSGFMFWKLDYLALDCSANDQIEVQNLAPSIAQGSDGRDFVSELTNSDDSYMEHLMTGDSTYVEFQGLAVNKNKARTIILQSQGYYLSQLKYDTKMERKALAKFKVDGEMSRFSKQLYEDNFGNLTLVLE